MTALQALAIAVLQGITELFPVSSLGHAVILPALLGWHIDQQAENFLPFLVVLHLGTATALFAYFWRDWLDLGFALFGIGAEDEIVENRRLIWLIVVATLPAVVLGFALEKEFRHLFGTPQAAAAFLMVNGGALFAGERLRHQTSSGELRTLTWKGGRALAVHGPDPRDIALGRHNPRRFAHRIALQSSGAFLIPDRNADYFRSRRS